MLVQNFTFGSFVFSHQEAEYFNVTYSDISLGLKIKTIDTSKNCGPQSNLNFVEYLWGSSFKQKYELFAITAVPFPNEIIRVAYLKHYRGASDGLTMRGLCYTGTEFHTRSTVTLYSQHTCKLPKDCACNICLRQPPSLRGLTSQAVFHLTFNIENFKLSPDTTYDLFEYAVRSNRVPIQNLIPNSFPILNLMFTHESNSVLNLHRHCANKTGFDLWPLRDFKFIYTFEKMVQTLIREREEWWCQFCDRGLFLRPECCDDEYI